MAAIRWKKWVLWSALSLSILPAAYAQQKKLSPAQRAAQFLKQRGISPENKSAALSGGGPASRLAAARRRHAEMLAAASGPPNNLGNPWTPVGPRAVQTGVYGLVSGRVTSIAADPSDTSGNTVYVGTTGGGVWKSTNAAGPASSVSFQPLTDTLPAFHNGNLASLSIGALTVQPGSPGVILAGTGDTNDASDSYYGEGLLRSADHGVTWSLIQDSSDLQYSGAKNFSFQGEGFSGFAWSTSGPPTVVAAVALSSASVAAGATETSSFAGLYYSIDGGSTWRLSTITDGEGAVIQAEDLVPPQTDPGNSATSITWNPVRKRFYAAIRFHGYYESQDGGVTFTRLANQPGVHLSAARCPANPNGIGSSACPIFRGVIVTQPVTGDMFALTVSQTGQLPGIWQDQGLWQDVCASSGNGCTASQAVTFSTQIPDAQFDDASGNIPQGDYNLTLAAVPSQQDTLLFAGTADLFRCSLLNCAWRNTTNVNYCASANVAPSEHAIDATLAASGLMYFGNDGGLWRTTDAVNQTGQQCSADDASHFQNLNGGIGSLAEIPTFSQDPANQDTLLAAMGAFGTAASASGQGAWNQVLDGEGDFNAIDPENPHNWYASSAAPVSINACTLGTACDIAAFGSPVIGNNQVGEDGNGLANPAAWILDPQDPSRLILGTCRVWRGPAANGTAWSSANLLSPMLDTAQAPFCNGNAQIRSLAASGSSADPPGAPEMIYAGMDGSFDGGFSAAGHIYGASVVGVPASMPSWSDLSISPITNSPNSRFNPGGFPVSSIYVDPHDSTGNTIYATIQGFSLNNLNGSLAYWSRDGGAHWLAIMANLPNAPANSIVVDPNDANTVYIALDTGVYATRNINQCTDVMQQCWTPFGTGLANAPVTRLETLNYESSMLRASTYGRGIWQIPLLSAGTIPTSAEISPNALSFDGQQVNTASAPQTVMVANTGSFNLTVTSVTASGDFSDTSQCSSPISPQATCAVQVTFTPSQKGPRSGMLTVFGNMPGGQATATLAGTGLPPGDIVLLPASLIFGSQIVGTTTSAQNITISNTGGIRVGLQKLSATGDFSIRANTCGASLPPNTGCTVSITFTPAASGPRAGVFSIVDDSGTQTVQLSGNGQLPATAQLNPAGLSFSPTLIGTVSAPQQVTLTNKGDVALTGITITAGSDFIAVNNCGPTLVGQTTCSITVSYAPTQTGFETQKLTVTTVLGSQSVALSGTGLAPPGVSLTPASFDFGSQAVSIASAPLAVRLTNNGGADLANLSAAVSGNGFSIATNGCPSGQTLPVGATCTLGVVFTPAQAGPSTGLVTVSAANLAHPVSTTLSGVGEDFNLLVSGSSSAVITSGQSATYSLQVVPVANSTGSIQLSCTGLPTNADATCNINPATVNLINGATSSATITVVTGVTTASREGSGWKDPWLAGSIIAAVLPFPWFFTGKHRRRLAQLAWLVCAVVALLTPVACGVHATAGGGGASSPPPSNPSGPTTPSGQYQLTITGATGTANALKKSVTVTLTVE